MTPNFSAPACTHPSAVAALGGRPSGACQRYQSPAQPPGPRRGGRLSALSAQPLSTDYGLESAKPDLQSTFKKPGAGVIRRASRACAYLKLGIASARYFGSKVREEDGELTKERSGGEPEWEPNGAGIMRVMMSGAATGCQADRARRVALELGTGGG